MSRDRGEGAAGHGSVEDGSDGGGAAGLADLKPRQAVGKVGFAAEVEPVEDAGGLLAELHGIGFENEAAAHLQTGEGGDEGVAEDAVAARAGKAVGGELHGGAGIVEEPELGIERWSPGNRR